jgi:hypothetical protein
MFTQIIFGKFIFTSSLSWSVKKIKIPKQPLMQRGPGDFPERQSGESCEADRSPKRCSSRCVFLNSQVI